MSALLEQQVSSGGGKNAAMNTRVGAEDQRWIIWL